MPSSEKHLVVKRSSLPGAGMGLFTTVAFRKGDRIVEYKGKRVSWKDVKNQDGYNGYLLRLDRLTALDAQPLIKTKGRYANDAGGWKRVKGLRNNAEYLIFGDRCFIEATRAIARGEEVFVGYGREFWALQKKIRLKKGEK